MAQKILFDTDPGIDDAMALLFALASPEIEVIGVTTVFGNVHTDLATHNALALLEFAGRPDIPVAQGATRPLHITFDEPATLVHAANGLGEVFLPKPTASPDPRPAAQFIAEAVMRLPGEIILAPVGPLTNIALALMLEPRIVERVAGVVLMGGAATVNGNVNPAAEANIWHDPHAADIVFNAGWPVTMLGLDVTMTVQMDDAYFAGLRSSPTGEFIYAISRFYLEFHRQVYGLDVCHTHDPSVIAYLIDPTLYTVEYGPIRVVTEGIATGLTLWDRRGKWRRPNAWTDRPAVGVCLGVDAPRMLALFRERIIGRHRSEQSDDF
ncbi:MAG: nucleoside hydrolase [Caldilinea sp.]|nr:nucleoside hydrolase [Caldilinea sp.]MDW8440372.1 nucleoside hydrolase [Caldilineaceae bacterium]